MAVPQNTCAPVQVPYCGNKNAARAETASARTTLRGGRPGGHFAGQVYELREVGGGWHCRAQSFVILLGTVGGAVYASPRP